MSEKFSFKERMTGLKKCPVCGQRKIPLDEDFCDECKGSGMSDLEREYRKNYPADTRKIIEKNGQLFYEKEKLKENESIVTTVTTRSRSSISSGDVWFYVIILVILLALFIFGRKAANVILFIIIAIVAGFFIWIYFFTPEKRERRKVEREERDRIARAKIEHEQQKIEEKERLRFEEYEELRKVIERMPKYENWKKEVFKKYGRKCEVCGEENNLEVHHRESLHSIINRFGIKNIYDAFECNRLWDVDNGSVICKECHEKMQSSQYRNQ